MWCRVLGPISKIEPIAVGGSIRSLVALRTRYGGRNWRKLKGEARVELADGSIWRAEIHWYEAHGIGRKMLKIKRFVG